MNKKSFILHKELGAVFAKLTDEQAGMFIKAIFHYQTNGSVPAVDPLIDLVLTTVISQFERDDENYVKICERNRENGKRGGRPNKKPRKPRKPSRLLAGNDFDSNDLGRENLENKKPRKPRKADSDNDNDNDNDNERGKKEAGKPVLEALILEVVNFYNENRGMMPESKRMSKTRKSHIHARLKDYGLDDVKAVLIKASKSDLMQGRNKRGWTANIDWIMNPENYIKIAEGNYNNRDLATSDTKRVSENKDYNQGW